MPNKPTTSAKKLARMKKDQCQPTRPSSSTRRPIRIQGYSFRFNNDAGQPFVGIQDGAKHYILTDPSGNHFNRLRKIQLKCVLCGSKNGGCESCGEAASNKKDEGDTSSGAKEEDEYEPKEAEENGDQRVPNPAEEEDERVIKRNASILTFGRGIELNKAPWGGRVVEIVFEVLQLQQFVENDVQLHAVIVNPRGANTGLISVRLSHISGTRLPDGSIVQKFCCHYRKQLAEAGRMGEIPRSLALEVMAFFDESDSHLAEIL